MSIRPIVRLLELCLLCIMLSACDAEQAAQGVSRASAPAAGAAATTDRTVAEPATPATSAPVVVTATVARIASATPLPTATPTRRPSATPQSTATDAPAITPTAGPLAIVQSASLNLRSGPGTGYEVVGSAASGDEMYPVAQVGNCLWLQVGVLGRADPVWVAGGANFVTLNVSCDMLIAADDMWPTPVPAPTQVPSTPRPAVVDAPRPATGLLKRYAAQSGEGELLIKNGTDGDGVVILADLNNNPVQAAYIRAAESFNMTQIADGTYRLFFAKGEGWDAAHKEFARNVTRQRFEDTMDFATTSTQYTGYEVTLYGVADGNAATQNVPAAQFPPLP